MNRNQRSADTIYLVSCVSKKQSKRTSAKDLYCSEWFKRASRVASSSGSRWFILSAKYGLVGSDERIAPYEETLNTFKIEARRQWAARVIKQWRKRQLRARRIVILAGSRYREFLLPYLREQAEVQIPLKGLPIGRQLQRLGRM
jgi:hypothetical protein